MSNKVFGRMLMLLTVLVLLVGTFASASPVSAAGGTAEYVVQSGENLTRIAKKYGLSLQKLLDANPSITDANLILVGQVITLPAGRSEGLQAEKKGRYFYWQLEKDGNSVSAEEQFYLVRSGDSLIGIAKAYGVKYSRLLAVNSQIEDPNLVFRGELVRIPEGRAEKVPPFYFTPAKPSK